MRLLNKKLEVRKAYFLRAFQRQEEEMAIISFAGCNFSCPYCKRDCQYIDSLGRIIRSRETSDNELFDQIDQEVKRGRRIRLSGGDPCVFPKQSIKIAEHLKNVYGQKISIAHNGSDFCFVETMLPYLEYIALDYKASTLDKMRIISGVKNPQMQQKEIIEICDSKSILVDVRTPIFANTDISELRDIAGVLKNYKNVFWTLRKYNQVEGCDFVEPDMNHVTNLAKIIKKEFPNIKIGTRNYWKGGFEIFH